MNLFIKEGVTLGQGTRDSERRNLEARGRTTYPWVGNTIENVSEKVHLKITFPWPLPTCYLVSGLSRPLMVFLFHPQPLITISMIAST